MNKLASTNVFINILLNLKFGRDEVLVKEKVCVRRPVRRTADED